MKPLFKARTSKFGSIVSLVVLSAMGMLFVYALPQFWLSSAGRIFLAVWAVLAMFAVTAHVKRLNPGPKRMLKSRNLTLLGYKQKSKQNRIQRG